MITNGLLVWQMAFDCMNMIFGICIQWIKENLRFLRGEPPKNVVEEKEENAVRLLFFWHIFFRVFCLNKTQ